MASSTLTKFVEGQLVNFNCIEGFGGEATIVEVNEKDYKIKFGNKIIFAFPEEISYSSTQDTADHIYKVKTFINICVNELTERSNIHDESKFHSPEKEVYDQITPLLKDMTYGSEEYKSTLRQMKPAIQHHYANNRHHPEHFENGIKGMNLIDLVEMICDWKAASLRHTDGDIRRSIEMNQERFGYSDDLKQIFLNTLEVIE